MPVTDYSTTAASNTSISGINIGEGCPAANINNAIRVLMSDVRVMYNALPSAADFVRRDGSVAFTGQPTFNGRGALLHWGSSTLSSGRMTIQASGGAAPSMSEGDWLIEY